MLLPDAKQAIEGFEQGRGVAMTVDARDHQPESAVSINEAVKAAHQVFGKNLPIALLDEMEHQRELGGEAIGRELRAVEEYDEVARGPALMDEAGEESCLLCSRLGDKSEGLRRRLLVDHGVDALSRRVSCTRSPSTSACHAVTASCASAPATATATISRSSGSG